MREGTPQINVSKIPGGGGIAGALFAVISMVIFLLGIPALRYFLPAAIIVGAVVALVIRSKRYETPGSRSLFAAARQAETAPQNPPAGTSSPRTLIPASALAQGFRY